MASSNNHNQLVASIQNAENEAENQGEAFFLVPLVAAATLAESPKYTLQEIYNALLDSKARLLLDPLNTLPLLVPSEKDASQELIQLISREGNAQEAVISVQEALEQLERAIDSRVDDQEEADLKHATQLTRLLRICCDSIPRLQLRRKGPAETLRPILAHLGSAIESIAPLCDIADGRSIISSVSHLIQAILPWQSQNARIDGPDYQTVTNKLADFLYQTLAACATHICASLAQRKLKLYNPRLVRQSAVDSDAEKGEEVMQEALDVARALGITDEDLASRPRSLGTLILVAHGQPTAVSTSLAYFQNLLPILTSSLQQNVAMDESLALLLTLLYSQSRRVLPQEIVDPVATLLTPLASTHPHPPTRLVVFRTLAQLLSRAPPPIHLAHLSSLVTNSPFPQMRVAAVGLVKEAFLNAVDSKDASPFKSTTFIRALGPTLLRPDPPDLFTSPTNESLKKLLESSEPARLTECLAFYYVLLKRDTTNFSGIRDHDMLRTVENGLLGPLRKALATWLEDSSSMEEPHALMPLASLETSLERVDDAVASL